MEFKYFAFVIAISFFLQSAAGVPRQTRQGGNNTQDSDIVNREDSSETNDINSYINRNYYDTRIEIEIPDYREGDRKHFIHDFNNNKTVIVDNSTERCFIMDLDYDKYPPPTSIFDLVRKGLDGVYDVDTSVVRQTMRVVLPPVTLVEDHESSIYNDCKSFTTYLLENVNTSIITNRSIRSIGTTYTEYTGKTILEFHIIDMDEVREYEGRYLT